MSDELLRLTVRGKDRWEIKHEAERRAKLFFEDVGHTFESADVRGVDGQHVRRKWWPVHQ